MVSRRQTLAVLAAAAMPALARAQAAKRATSAAPRVGILMSGDRASATAWLRGFRDGLRVLGTPVAAELSFADGKPQALPGLADQLVSRGVRAIVAADEPAFQATKEKAARVPLIVGDISTPVDAAPRIADVLAALMPKVTQVAVLMNAKNSSHRPFLTAFGAAAERKRWKVMVAEADTPDDTQIAFDHFRASRIGAVVVAHDGLFSHDVARIADLARTRRIGAVGQMPSYAEAGFLFSAGEDPEPRFSKLAQQVDRVLKGGAPEAAKFHSPRIPVTVNQVTAKALGVGIPPGVSKNATLI